MTETLVAATGSLLGVVLGGVLTYFFTSRAQLSKTLHDSRIASFARFATAVMEYRRSLMERWYVENGVQVAVTESDDVYKTRSAAWAAMFEVQLLAGKETVGPLARAAVDATSAIKNADSRPHLTAQADESRKRIEAFVVAARDDIAANLSVR